MRTWHGRLERNDRVATKYSVKSKSLKWPLQVCLDVPDVAGINVLQVLYTETTGGKGRNFCSS